MKGYFLHKYNDIPITSTVNESDVAMSIVLVVKVGSNADGFSMQGRAHFLEHYLLDAALIKQHFSISAKTCPDRTIFEVKCNNTPTNYSTALDIIGKIANGYFLKESNLEIVRGEVLEEYERTQATSVFKEVNWLIQTVPENVHMVIGTKQSISNMTFANICDFFCQHYVASNLHIFIHGIKSLISQSDDWTIDKTDERPMINKKVYFIHVSRVASDHIKQQLIDALFLSALREILGYNYSIHLSEMVSVQLPNCYWVYKISVFSHEEKLLNGISDVILHLCDYGLEPLLRELKNGYLSYYSSKINDENYWISYSMDCFVLNNYISTPENFLMKLKSLRIEEVVEFIKNDLSKAVIYNYPME